ncbi:MAG: DEAD/DEAH box helicase, partial [Oliverpabstia sp.]
LQNMNTVSYGKKLEFLHCVDAFDEESKKLIHFIEKSITSTELEYYRHYGIVMRGEAKSIALSESELDEVMNLFEGKSVRVEYQTGSKVKDMICQVVKESPRQKISIREEDKGIVLQHKTAKGIKGINYVYYVSQPRTAKIYIVERKDTENLEEFLNYMEERKGNDVFIGKEELPAFCCNVLPQLEKFCNVIRGDFMPEKYLPEKAKFQFYLDSPQRDMISCRAMAAYGEQQYNLFPASDENVGKQVRDLQKEGYAKTCILKYFYAYDEKSETMVLQGEDDMYRFLTDGIEILKGVGEVFVSEQLKKIQVISKVSVQVGVSLSGNLLHMEIGSEQFSREQLAEILSRYEKKKKYYRLKSGDFIRMDEDEMQVLYDLKEDLLLTDKQLKEAMISLPRYRALYLDGRLRGEGIQTSKNREFKQLVRDMKTIEDNDFEIPDSLIPILREYQKTGFLWMKTLCHNQFGGILADDMGLGKTLQTIAFLLSEFQEAGTDKRHALIITPASLVYNWKSEFEKFAPELMVHTVVGTVKEREQILSNLENQVIIITSYQLLYRDEELYEKIPFDYQIIDEAQFIKNQGNQTTKAVKSVDARFRMALTGTPIENKLSELWSIFDYIMPGFLYKYQRFRNEIETPVVKNQDQKVMERLQKMIQPFVLRRTKKEVLKELPDKIERCMYAQLDGEQREIYLAHAQRMQMQLKNQTEEEFKTSKIQILAEITRLRQICCDPALLYEKYNGPSAKLDLCIELIKNAVESGHKILLFSQFTTMLDRITKALEGNEISYYLLTGKTSKEERAAMAERFNHDDTSVFCISLKAGGTGLNLTGADMVIHYDPWWNAAVETQATDRAHRIGQKQVVTVYKLIARDTLEEKITELQSKKKELASQVMGGEGISQASFSKEELLRLLE